MKKMRLEAEINSLRNDNMILREQVQKLESQNHYLRVSVDEKSKLNLINRLRDIVHDDEVDSYSTKENIVDKVIDKIVFSIRG